MVAPHPIDTAGMESFIDDKTQGNSTSQTEKIPLPEDESPTEFINHTYPQPTTPQSLRHGCHGHPHNLLSSIDKMASIQRTPSSTKSNALRTNSSEFPSESTPLHASKTPSSGDLNVSSMTSSPSKFQELPVKPNHPQIISPPFLSASFLSASPQQHDSNSSSDLPASSSRNPHPTPAASATRRPASSSMSACNGAFEAAKVMTNEDVIQVGSNRYIPLGCIGKGGSSKVYKVLSEDLNLYALKKVSLKNTDPNTTESFLNEIQLLKRLQHHPTIIRYVDSQVTDQILYLVLPKWLSETY